MRVLLICLVLTNTNPHTELLDAIKQVESGGDNNAIGDSGASLGGFQITHQFYTDAVEFDRSLRKHKYNDVKKDYVARLVIRAYWRRYCTKKRLGREPTDVDRMRLVNGGCNAYKFQYEAKEKRLKIYVAKVQAELKKKAGATK